MNNRRLDERVYGDIPDQFDSFLKRTLKEEPGKAMRLKPRIVLILALGILLIACSALAVVYRVSLLDVFGIGAVDPGRVDLAIIQTVEQSGGEASVADFTVREVYYDGSFLRFIIDSDVKDENKLYCDLNLYNAEIASEAEPHPDNRYGVRAEATIEGAEDVAHLFDAHNQGSLVLAANAFFQHPMPEHINVDVEIFIESLDSGMVIEATTLSFAVQQTEKPTPKQYPAQLDAGTVLIKDVSIASTPFETILTIEYRPLLKAFSGFRLVCEDGYVTKDGARYQFGMYAPPYHGEDIAQRLSFILPFETAQNDTLTLWFSGTDKAVEIDLRTGVLSVLDIRVESDGKDTWIERIGGNR